MMMDENRLVKKINTILRFSWSKKQMAEGKKIEVLWDWAGIIGPVVHKYKECGWIVKKLVELDAKGRNVYLVFINPNWASNPDRELPC